MGGAPCLIIIKDGGRALAAVEILAKRCPDVDTELLFHAVDSSCRAISYVSLYRKIAGHEPGVPEYYATPIVNAHKRIIDELPLVKTTGKARVLVKELQELLWAANDELTEIYE